MFALYSPLSIYTLEILKIGFSSVFWLEALKGLYTALSLNFPLYAQIPNLYTILV